MDAILPLENYKKTLVIGLDKYIIFVRAQGSIYLILLTAKK